MYGWQPLEHTSDIGLECWGDSLQELVRAVVEGFLCLSFEQLPAVIPEKEIELEFSKQDEFWLLDFLRELIYYWSAHRFVPCIDSIKVEENGEKIRVRMKLGRPAVQPVKEIKAATLHGYALAKENERWKARIIFDV
ncbi:MAG: archease [bacterium]|nr:archease [bacterium]